MNRLAPIAPKVSKNVQTRMFHPLYDWRDTDIWRYIRDKELAFPDTYMHLYQTGSTRRQMRISQFFSIDTARSLVKMEEYEPGLMDRITRREPNAYLAALYWDTEMFRGSGGSGEAGPGGGIDATGEGSEGGEDGTADKPGAAVLIASVPGIAVVQLFIIYGTLRACTLVPTILMLSTRGPVSERGAFWGILGSLVVALPLSAVGNLTGTVPLIVAGSLAAIGVSGVSVLVGTAIERRRAPSGAAAGGSPRSASQAAEEAAREVTGA